MNKKVYLIFAMLFFISLVQSSSIETLGIFKQGTAVELTQVCSNCTYVNISSITYPNRTLIATEKSMTQSGVAYNYSLSNSYTNTLGRYIVCGYGDPDGIKDTWCYDFFINGTGREEPSGAVSSLFIIAFLIVMFLFVWLFVYSMGHAIKKDFDIVDLGFDFGIYFMLFSLFILQQQYMGNPLMDSILNVFVYVGAFTHILFSSIFFFVSMFKASTDRTQQIMSGGVG